MYCWLSVVNIVDPKELPILAKPNKFAKFRLLNRYLSGADADYYKLTNALTRTQGPKK